MSNWNPYILTATGAKMIAQTGIVDNALTFSSLKVSSQAYTTDQLPDLTSLSDIKGSFPFESKEIVNATTVKLQSAVSNNNVMEAYTWNTTGIYAIDSIGAEVLFAVSTAIDAPVIRPFSENGLNQFTLNIYFQVSNADKVTIQVDMDTYVTQEQLVQLNESLTDLEKRIYNTIYPVGRTILDFGNTDPNTQFNWMTWEKVGAGSALISAGDTYKVGTVVGSNTKLIAIKNLPAHTHKATMDNQGGHIHTGTTSFAGKHIHTYSVANPPNPDNAATGSSAGHWETRNTSEAGLHNHTVSLNSAGGHIHNITVQATGNGEAFDVMQQSIAVWVWKRIA